MLFMLENCSELKKPMVAPSRIIAAKGTAGAYKRIAANHNADNHRIDDQNIAIAITP